MKKIFLGILISAAFICLSSFKSGKGEVKPVYVYGVAASFTDTVLYITDVQKLEGAALDKSKFLPFRDGYSYQLKVFLEGTLGAKDRVCAIFFSEDIKKLNKGAVKMYKKYAKNGAYSIRRLTKEEFEFQTIEP